VGSNASGLRLEGGSAFNAVPDSVVYSGHGQEALARKLDAFGFAYSRTAAGIEVHGKAAHAMAADKGMNAIARLCLALEAIGYQSKAISFVAREIGEDPHATGIFGPCSDTPSGKLMFNVGKIALGDAEANPGEVLSIDCRIPVTVAREGVVSQLRDVAARYGLEYKEFDWLAPLYVPQDHEVVQTLMRVYREVSGDSVTEPIASGGATYARAMPNCVAFGPIFPGEPITEHQPNERVVLGNLYKAMEIYAHAIYELTR
jgi:acetylornithine deacetylase/succinyl-diaminopimelate desuccinylase-like protein